MTFDDCCPIGYIVKTHGFNGTLVVKLEKIDIKKLDSVFFMIKNQLIPYFVSQVTSNSSMQLLQLEEITSKEEALILIGKTIYFPKSKLKKESKEFIIDDLINFELINEKQSIGTVVSIYQPSSLQYLLGINYNEKEVLIPFSENIILKIDKKNKRIYASLPEGLLDLN